MGWRRTKATVPPTGRDMFDNPSDTSIERGSPATSGGRTVPQ